LVVGIFEIRSLEQFAQSGLESGSSWSLPLE
jgi:hypothetical protein